MATTWSVDAGPGRKASTGTSSRAALGSRLGKVVELPIAVLRLGPTPRLTGMDPGHIRLLVELDGAWPPTLVTKKGRIVIDGQHRYHAARALKRVHIQCLLTDIGEDAVFTEAVRSNVSCGLPLTLRDRKHAATAILRSHEQWSDRRIAEVCGLAHGTIAALRATLDSPAGQHRHLDVRLGRDGRRRTVDRTAARRRVAEALGAEPLAPLRRIAELAGVSPETVRAVRRAHGVVATHATTGGGGSEPELSEDGADQALSPWHSDAALQATAATSDFVAWFARTGLGEAWRQRAGVVPLSRIYEIADEARVRATRWREFADVLESRASRR